MNIKYLFAAAILVFLIGIAMMLWWYLQFASDDTGTPLERGPGKAETPRERERTALETLNTNTEPWTAERERETHNALEALSAGAGASTSGSTTASSSPAASAPAPMEPMDEEAVNEQMRILDALSQ